MLVLAPEECKKNSHARKILESLTSDQSPIKRIHYCNLNQSMNNGGGPACLRLRIPMNEKELSAIHQGVLLTDALYDKLIHWVNKHYREELKPQDLGNFELYCETQHALKELETLLNLKGLYSF